MKVIEYIEAFFILKAEMANKIIQSFSAEIIIGDRDTIRGNSIENWGYFYIYMFGRT